MALNSCATQQHEDRVRFDYDTYRNGCIKNVCAELFTTGTTAAAKRMPQDNVKFSRNPFPIALGSPMIHALIVNYRNVPLRLKDEYLRSSLFAVGRSGYYETESPSDWFGSTKPDIIIPPYGSYAYRMSYPPLTDSGVFSVRMQGIYTEPLRIKIRK